jgi:hypothetical protein
MAALTSEVTPRVAREFMRAKAVPLGYIVHQTSAMLSSLAHFVRTVVFAIVAIIAFVILLNISAWPVGWLAAQYDVLRGHYEIKGGGLGSSYGIIMNQLLKARYGVTTSSSGGCFILPHQLAYLFGYNAASKPAINKHFGKDVFAECHKVTKAKLEEIAKADLMIIARPLSTTEITDSLTVAGHDAKDFQGLDTKLQVVGTLEGQAPEGEITLRHFRYSPTGETSPSGALFLNFRQGEDGFDGQIKSTTGAKETGKNSNVSDKPSYLLSLKLRPDGNYEPVTGQYDAALSSREIRPEVVPALLKAR